VNTNLLTNVIGVVLALWCSHEAKAVGRGEWRWMIAAIFAYAVPYKFASRGVAMLAGGDCSSTLSFAWMVSTLAGIGAVIWMRNRYLMTPTHDQSRAIVDNA